MTPLVRGSVAVSAAAAAAMAVRPALWRWPLGVVLLDQAVLVGAGMAPRCDWLGPNLVRHAGPGVALTFDDGPDPAVTPRVLDLLDAAGAVGTFFCVGERARRWPGVVREIARRGHAVGNHSNTHPGWFACLGVGGLRREVERAQATLGELTGRAPGLFRAPMGLRSPLLEPVLAASGLRLVSWTRRALDGAWGDPHAAERRLRAGGLAAGEILLMHDGRAARTPAGGPVVLAVLPRLLATGCGSVGLR